LWTDEILNYFDTEKKKLRLNPTGLKFTKWFYIILAIPFLVIASFIGYSAFQDFQYTEESIKMENMAVGDKLNTMMNLIESNKLTQSYNT